MVRCLFQRLYRVRPVPALFMALPGLLLVTWYGWLSFSKLHRYRSLAGESTPLTAEVYHIALHDLITTDWRRLFMPPPPEKSKLQTFSLILGRSEWGQLMDSADIRDDRPYVRGKVEDSVLEAARLEARIRLRGGRHWHLAETQKSFKIKMDKGDLLVGSRVGNLLNDPTPMVIGEQVILDLARKSGILTPKAHFARVKINTKDLGVYHYEAGADESMLREAKRIPGSIYSGELSGSAPTSALWDNHDSWTKVSTRTDAEADKLDFTQLSIFLRHVREDTSAQFAEFARNDLDLEKFALMDVLDVAFGGDQHDFRENHKYYLDPYHGRWEPIAWNFRGFQSDPHFNIVDNPILLRLKFIPGYLTLRNRLLYNFLTTEGSPSAVAARASNLLKDLAPELQSDAYFDAYHQLPRIDTLHRRMVRPMTIQRLALVAESELVTYSQRHAQLLSELERNPLYVEAGITNPVGSATSVANAPHIAREPGNRNSASLVTPLRVVTNGEVGADLLRVTFDTAQSLDAHATHGSPRCLPTSASLQRVLPSGQTVVVPTIGAKQDLVLAEELSLPPAVQIVSHERPNARRGDVRAVVAPGVYDFQLVTDCAPANIVVEGRHAATGARVLARPLDEELRARLPQTRSLATDIPRFAVGELSPHPWSFDAPKRRDIVLGPGDVEVEETRIFTEHERVTIEPGTTFHMGAKASLIFLGKVQFSGTADAPIIVAPSSLEPWGGIAVQGPATVGSRFRHVVIKGGTEPVFRSVEYPAMVNIHGTTDIELENCKFGAHNATTDVVHAAYVDNLRIADTEVRQVGGDAIDLEFTTAKLKGVHVIGAGDDGLDLMGSDVELSDSMLLGLEGNGVSAGEESRVVIRNSIIADSKIGVQAKNASSATLSGSLLLNTEIGVRTYQRTVRYAGDSRVAANVLYIVAARKQAVKRKEKDDDGEVKLDQGRVLQALPRRGDLDHVLQNVVRLTNWEELPAWLSRTRTEVVPWL